MSEMQEWRLLAPVDMVYTVGEVRKIAEAVQDLMTALPGVAVTVVVDGVQIVALNRDPTRSSPRQLGEDPVPAEDLRAFFEREKT